jgi:hypothetical protein
VALHLVPRFNKDPESPTIPRFETVPGVRKIANLALTPDMAFGADLFAAFLAGPRQNTVEFREAEFLFLTFAAILLRRRHFLILEPE